MNEALRKEISLFRYAIIAPLISGTVDEGESLNKFFLDASKKKYQTHEGKLVSFSVSTLQRWYYDYKRDGLDGLAPKRRNDSGQARKLDDDLKNQIRYLKAEYPRIPATVIHQKLMASGALSKGEVSLSTITRFINQIKKEERLSVPKEMRRYERQHINEVWYADTSVAFKLDIEGTKKKTYIIAFMDDRSRYIVGIDVFFNDNFINAMSVMKSAVSAHGKPKIFSFDNGSPYKNGQMDLIIGRLGSVLNLCAPYSPQSKAKLERFFGTMKSHWLALHKPSDFNSLDEMRSSLKAYVHQYNTTVHSALGDTPQNVFFSESVRIKRIEEEALEKAFLLELERKVSVDNVIKIDKEEYEVPYRFSKQKVTLRYSPDLSHVYIVDSYTGDLEPINLLKKNDNAHVKREVFQFKEADA